MRFEGLQLGRYRLLHQVGRGGAGNVYLADDQRLTRQVAIKVIESEDPNSDVAKEATRLFEREARTIAMLSHPNILPLFDFGEETIEGSTFVYLVLPFCPEGSLVKWLSQFGGTPMLPPQQVLHIVQQAADALEYAHDKQIIHRDVKPSNFLIRSRKSTPDRPDLLLADFGIARFSLGTINASKTIRGTPKYMAPEQWRGAPVPATDQYALAIVAYELLTSRPPFMGTQEQVMYGHLLTQPQPPSAVNLRVTAAIDAVILQALAKQPEARFPSVSDFARAFQQAVTETGITPVISITPSSPYLGTIVSSPVPVSTYPPPVRDTPHISISNPGIVQSSELHATLNISTTEAIDGVNRTLTLSDGQHVKVAVPAGAYDGQVIRLENQVEPSSPNVPKRDLVVTIVVTPTSESAVIETIPGAAPPRFKWKTLMLIGFVVLILLAGLASFAINQFASKPTVTTTVSNKNNPFNALQATNSAATASAATNATATAQVAATAAVRANPYDSGSWTLALNEPLNKNSTSRWDEASGSCSFAPDGYHVTNAAQAAAPQVCIAHSHDYGDMTFQVNMKVLGGSAGGILFRSSGSASYYFRVNQNGTYALLACAGAGISCNTTLTNGFSSFINTGLNQSNTIAVVAKGNSIQLYVNGEPVNSVNNSLSLHGQVGVIAEAGSEVVFSNVRVWTA